jgi:hypothetical protein
MLQTIILIEDEKKKIDIGIKPILIFFFFFFWRFDLRPASITAEIFVAVEEDMNNKDTLHNIEIINNIILLYECAENAVVVENSPQIGRISR